MFVKIYDGYSSYKLGQAIDETLDYDHAAKKFPVYVGEVSEFKLKREANSVDSFDFSINDVKTNSQIFKKNNLYFIEVLEQDKIITIGIAIEVEVDLEKDVLNFTCNDPLYLLNYLPGLPWSGINRKNIVANLWVVLQAAANNLYDAAATNDNANQFHFIPARLSTNKGLWRASSMDLRDQKDAYSQMIAVLDTYRKQQIKTVGETYLRVSDDGTGAYTSAPAFLLEFGSFDRNMDITSMPIFYTSGMKEKSIKVSLEPEFGFAEPYGGLYSPVPNDPQVPITVLDSTELFVDDNYEALNLVASNKVQLKSEFRTNNFYRSGQLYFSELIPISDTDAAPSPSEIQHVASTLIQRTVSEMETETPPTLWTFELEDCGWDYDIGQEIRVVDDSKRGMSYNQTINIPMQENTISSITQGVYFLKDYEITYENGFTKGSFVLSDINNYNFDLDPTQTLSRIKKKLQKQGEYIKVARPKTKMGYAQATISANSSVIFRKYNPGFDPPGVFYELDWGENEAPPNDSPCSLIVLDFDEYIKVNQVFEKRWGVPTNATYFYGQHYVNTKTSVENGPVGVIGSFPTSTSSIFTYTFTNVTTPFKITVCAFYEV